MCVYRESAMIKSLGIPSWQKSILSCPFCTTTTKKYSVGSFAFKCDFKRTFFIAIIILFYFLIIKSWVWGGGTISYYFITPLLYSALLLLFFFLVLILYIFRFFFYFSLALSYYNTIALCSPRINYVCASFLWLLLFFIIIIIIIMFFSFYNCVVASLIWNTFKKKCDGRLVSF